MSTLIEARQAKRETVSHLRLRPRTPEIAPRRASGLGPGQTPALSAVAAGRLLAASSGHCREVHPGEQAALSLVAAETARRGDCRLAIEHIASVAGVSRSTVKAAIREARKLGLLMSRNGGSPASATTRTWCGSSRRNGPLGCGWPGRGNHHGIPSAQRG